MTESAKAMLRALRDELTPDAVFTGSNARAAHLAGMREDAAALALAELGRRGMIHLRRSAPQR